MSVTAKVRVFKSAAYNDDVRLDFTADYNGDRNKDWAAATPVLSLMMYVKPEVAERFEHGAAYTLTFEPEA